MPKNVPTIVQLHLFHRLAMLCSKSFKLGFSNTWTKNFQIPQLDLEKAEEPEIKLQTFVGSWRKEGNSRKICTSASLTMRKPLTVWIATNYGKFLEMGVPDHLTCFLRSLYAGQEARVRTEHGTTDWKMRERSRSRTIYCHPACLTSMQSTSWKMLS